MTVTPVRLCHGPGGQSAGTVGSFIMRRRTFIGAVFAGLSLTGLYAKPPKPREGDIPTRPFGRTGVALTVIGQGGARLELMRDKDVAKAHVQRAYELGINYFDCAHSYWNGLSEEVYGEALKDVRKEVFLTSKSTQRTAEEANKELDTSLKRLKTDYLDLWQMHAIGTEEDLEKIFAPGGAIEAFEWAKQQGKCRFIGFTGHHDPDVMVKLLETYDFFDSVLMPLHAADPAYRSFERTVLPLVTERRMAVQGMKNFGNAFLLRALNPRECLNYVLSLPIHCTAVGCSTIGQLEEDVRIAQDFKKLDDTEMARLRRQASQATGALTGSALEYWKKQ